MKRRAATLLLGMSTLLAALSLSASTAKNEDASDAGCLPKATVTTPQTVCAGCHKDALQHWESRRWQPCSNYCQGCHKSEQMGRHHKVDVVLENEPENGFKLTTDHRDACFTCHDLSLPRYDSARWKAASLFDKMFRQEARYKTYFLVQRNDSGQLCLNCH